MRFVLYPINRIALVAAWLKLKFSESFVRDELSFYGAYGPMAGLHAYKKRGVWHFGYKRAPEEEAESSVEIQERERAPRTVTITEPKEQFVSSLPRS